MVINKSLTRHHAQSLVTLLYIYCFLKSEPSCLQHLFPLKAFTTGPHSHISFVFLATLHPSLELCPSCSPRRHKLFRWVFTMSTWKQQLHIAPCLMDSSLTPYKMFPLSFAQHGPIFSFFFFSPWTQLAPLQSQQPINFVTTISFSFYSFLPLPLILFLITVETIKLKWKNTLHLSPHLHFYSFPKRVQLPFACYEANLRIFFPPSSRFS